MTRSNLTRFLSPAFVLFATFVSAYVPTIYMVMTTEGGDPIAALRKPDLIGGLMGFLFSVLLAIGEANYLTVKRSIENLNKKIEAQSHGNRLQEAYLKAKEGPYSALFGNLAEIRLRRIHSDLEDMMRDLPFYEVRQNDPVKEYVDIFVQLMLGIIHPGSEFRVVTTELIWSSNSFGGPDRRYLLANYIAAKERQVKLRRVFMVDRKESLRKEPERARRLLDMLRDHERTFSEPGIDVDLAVYEVESDSDFHGFFKNPSNNFALWNVSESHSICTVVEYTHSFSNGYSISGFKFDSNPMLIKEKSAVYDNLRQRSTELQSYIKELDSLIKEAEKVDPSQQREA